jgi:uncharacterized protein involved in exopolysaccharide biosynthesis
LDNRLNDLLTNYTEQHPEVVSVRRTLAELRVQKEKGLDRPAGGSAVISGPAVDTSGARLLQADAEARAAALKEQIVVYERQLQEMKPMAGRVPAIEAELAKLNRDYDVIKTTYAQLVQRREAIKLAEGAQTVADSMFKVIEAPRIPLVPVGPPRLLLTTATFGAALVIGIALAWLRAQGNPTFYTRSQLASLGGVPVLGSVSMNWSLVEVAKRQFGALVFGVSGLALIAAYIAMLMQLGFDFKGQFNGIVRLLESIRS